jgi:hypothetical protein
MIVICESVVPISYCQPRSVLVPQKFGPEFVDGVKIVSVNRDDHIAGFDINVIGGSIMLHTGDFKSVVFCFRIASERNADSSFPSLAL